MTGSAHGKARVAGVAVGAAALAAIAALGAGALATPAPSPSESPSSSPSASSEPEPKSSDTAEADDTQADDTERGGPAQTPPGQSKQKEARGNGQGARSPVPVDCAAARNHGEYVSGVARTTPPGPDKAATVAAAAESDCPPGFRDRPED